ncbi:MAG: Nramp family divalent metal transporter, partial [Mycolicibacterium aromaticivorans]|nr:Nramp family divalent metal transporter [Mycolicibacterium aromaticivorans]
MRARTAGWSLLGPAFVAAIAYVDPGNVAANISAGAQFGFLLVWVIVMANVMAGLVQYLSAKLGLVTGRTLPEAVRDHTRTPTRIGYWLQAELVAIATDVAEVVGGAIALRLLFGLPFLVGGVITGVVSLILLAVQDRRGQQVFERVITGLLLVIAIGFLSSLFVLTPPAAEVLGGLLPRFDGPESVLLATAMLGATVMPHAVYLHSGLARDRHGHPEAGAPRARLLRITRWDVSIAMLVAGAVNMSMLLIAATNLQGRDDTDSIEGAHAAV